MQRGSGECGCQMENTNSQCCVDEWTLWRMLWGCPSSARVLCHMMCVCACVVGAMSEATMA
jgi:hypothetical protein